MDTEKADHTNVQDDLSQEEKKEEKKPIIDQMTDLAAQSAGNLAETAVKAVAKKAKNAAAKRLPRSVKKATNTIAKATTTKNINSAKRSAKKSRTAGRRAPQSTRS